MKQLIALKESINQRIDGFVNNLSDYACQYALFAIVLGISSVVFYSGYQDRKRLNILQEHYGKTASSVAYAGSGCFVHAPTLADYNRDGHVDAVVGGSGLARTAEDLRVLQDVQELSLEAKIMTPEQAVVADVLLRDSSLGTK